MSTTENNMTDQELRAYQAETYYHLYQTSQSSHYDLPDGHQLCRYIAYGSDLGGFLSAVVRDELGLASCTADGRNRNRNKIGDYGRFMTHHAPISCRGHDNMRTWRGIGAKPREEGSDNEL